MPVMQTRKREVRDKFPCLMSQRSRGKLISKWRFLISFNLIFFIYLKGFGRASPMWQALFYPQIQTLGQISLPHSFHRITATVETEAVVPRWVREAQRQ